MKTSEEPLMNAEQLLEREKRLMGSNCELLQAVNLYGGGMLIVYRVRLKTDDEIMVQLRAAVYTADGDGASSNILDTRWEPTNSGRAAPAKDGPSQSTPNGSEHA